jgi:DNA polymerase I-like protein with 3'-5' exonuclease and polymerase domains
VPPDATRITHKTQREQFKACALAVQYGMGADSLAARIGQPPIRARELLDLHRRTYAKFWKSSDGMTAQALLTNRIQTCFGWTLHVDRNPNTRSLQNFPMQSHGAEMMRLAACLGTEPVGRGCDVAARVQSARPTARISMCARYELW